MLFKNPSRHFSAIEVSHEQRSNQHSASNQLEQLTKHGLLKVNDAKMYQYAPGDDELHQKVEKLYELYKEMPVAVITCIYDKPKDKLKDLSDAFKLKKD